MLLREKDGSYNAVNGTKGYRWLESEVVRNLNKYDDIDRGYFQKLADDAVENISKYCDYESFVAETAEDYVNAVPFMNAPEEVKEAN